METILGIDLGTTNSVVSIIDGDQPVVLKDERGESVLPSVVGFDAEGRLLVGREARNQALSAPERTVKSVKRRMGDDEKLTVGDDEYSPQEISAMILRTLKDRAEKSLGRSVEKAVVTVPAFFNDKQREATREAGLLAGLDVVRIINEPTAASLTYNPKGERLERLLIFDLGGGTFDVSIVQVEQGVIEVLASHGDTHLGGDDFDKLLLDAVCDDFKKEHDVDLREMAAARSRMLQAVEAAKIRLSSEACTTLAEEFIAEKDGTPLNLNVEIDRADYEDLIEPLLSRTLKSVDVALEDAKLTPKQIDRVILVGGSSRTPMVRRLLKEQLDHEPHLEIDPDLCVSLGAAVQGGLIAGIDVGPVLVDISTHTLGIECMAELNGMMSRHAFSAVIPRNTPLPAVRSEIYYTARDGQKAAEIKVRQGEKEDARFNDAVGEFLLDGLNTDAAEGNEILVRFALNLDGILQVAAVERDTGRENAITIDNAITRFRAKNRDEALNRLATVFNDQDESRELDLEEGVPVAAGVAEDVHPLEQAATRVVEKAKSLLPDAAAEDAKEIRQLIDRLNEAVAAHKGDEIESLMEQVEDVLFYLEDA